MRKMQRVPIILLCYLVVNLFGCGGQSGNKEVVLKLGHGLDTTHPVHKAMVFMSERAQEQSAGQLRIEIYPNEQLGSERESLEQLQLGALPMTKTSYGPMESFVPAMKVFGMPYLFRDSQHMQNVLQGEIGKELLQAGESKGLKGLCYYDAGARSFYTSAKPVHQPEDLKGLKIRVMKSEMGLKMIEAMGGSPTPIDWGELYTSLQQGVVDGAENNPPSFVTARHYETCKYYSLDEHLRLPDVLLISTAVWNKLSPEHQQILTVSAQESADYQRKLWVEMEQASLAKAKEAGVTIIVPDKEPFRKSVEALWTEFEDTEIGQMAKRIQAVQ